MADLIFQLLLLLGSLAMLVVAGQFTIREIERLIEYTGLGKMSVGFVLLAILTSLPEVTVAVFSVFEGTPGLSIGDVLGSNVFNMGLVLGVIALAGYTKKCCSNLVVELTDMLFLITLIPLLLLISSYQILTIPAFVVGIILLAAFAINTYLIINNKTPQVKEGSRTRVGKGKLGKVVLILAISLAGLLIAARLIVYSGLNIATAMGIPQLVIGAKIVAIGTSLPELVVGFIAARRGNVQLALGNVVGSNLTNLTLVLGIILVSSPFMVDTGVLTGILPFLIITTIIFWRTVLRGGVSKLSGVALILTYLVFVLFL
ncbi:MAG: sodium:calcium antiporter [Candidatus Bathyarchaeota archaeon]|nr:sodium:calcium antiporter [Candidatus Bathyarchaeota archaeon]